MDSTQLLKIENGRAEHAYSKAKEASQKEFAGDYKPYVKKLPMLIKTNGLGSSFAFILSKKDKNEGKAYFQIAKDVLAWLKKSGKIESEDIKDVESFVKHLISLDSYNYRILTSEVLAYLQWLKRFSDGLIEKGD